MESEHLESKLAGLRGMLTTLAHCENMQTIGHANIPQDRRAELLEQRIEQLERVKGMELADVVQRRADAWHRLTPAERRHYAAEDLSRLSFESVRKLALLEDIDIALGIHPAIREV